MRSDATFSLVARDWQNHRSRMLELGMIERSTVENQSRIAEALGAALDGPISDLRKSRLDLYVGGRLQTCKPVTVRGEINVLRQILNWAVEEGYLTERPKMPKVPASSTEQPLPDDASFIWFLLNLPEHHASALEFMLLTGLAPHELARLRKDDVSGNPPELHIGHRADFKVKTPSRRRVIPLNGSAAHIWKRAGWAADGQIFPSEAAMQKAMRRLVTSRTDAPEAADGLTPKLMRKWFASKIAADHSEAVLQRLLGHAPGSPITRRHYIRSQDGALVAAVDGLGLKVRGKTEAGEHLTRLPR